MNHLKAVPLALAAIAVLSCLVSPASSAILEVPGDHLRVTDALAAASPGDTVQVAAGTYSPSQNGETYPFVLSTTGVQLLGAGMGISILDAEGSGSVVEILTSGTRLSGFTLTGGVAANGGGVHVMSGDAVIDSCLILDNGVSLKGSGIFATNGATPWIHHNVVWESYDIDVPSGGDPHGIQLTGANGLVEHNLIGRGDSNGLLFEGAASAPTVRNNIFYKNGIPGLRGRGICALGDSLAVISHNLFWANEIASILIVSGGVQDLTAQQANDFSLTDNIHDNKDGDPLFVDAENQNWNLEAISPAIDMGDPAAGPDPDGTAPDIGPFYYPQVVAVAKGPPAGIAFLPPAPNPFRSRTSFSFTLPSQGHVRFRIYDGRGRAVVTLLDRELPAGNTSLSWNGQDKSGLQAGSGIYFARLEYNGSSLARTLLLLR